MSIFNSWTDGTSPEDKIRTVIHMKKFIEFFGTAHLNSKNIAAYSNEAGVALVAENVETGKEFGEMQFDSYEEAENWFGGLPGSNNVSRLDSALEALSEKK